VFILGIETSCDETAVAIAKLEPGHGPYSWGGIALLGEQVASQIPVHVPYGGVVPEIAAREHLEVLPALVTEVLKQAGVSEADLTCVAVTRGPGLKGCLLIGFCFGVGYALGRGIAALGVNHIEGHLWSPLLGGETPPELPALGFIVSGGHTEIVLIRGLGQYELLARTIDDAAGEAFDKAAALLGFPYPGGAALSRLADSVEATGVTFPRVMKGKEGFSFSGLKTAIFQEISRREPLDEPVRAALAHAVQESIVEVLTRKVEEAAHLHGVRTLLVSGGVAANRCLRNRLQQIQGLSVLIAPHQYCGDNAAMIAQVGAWRFARGERLLAGDAVVSRWPLEDL
jgi:N6-L-threonylcarbamoyladenine synthase